MMSLTGLAGGFPLPELAGHEPRNKAMAPIADRAVLTVKSLAIVLVSFLAIDAFAQQPIGFKDLLLGMPLSESGVSKKLKCVGGDNSDCSYSIEDQFRANQQLATTEEKVKALETIAGVPIGYLSVSRREGAIQTIYIAFSANGFRSVKEAMTEKFPGMKCVAGQTQNRMGATFDQDECLYQAPDGSTVTLRKRSTKIDESTAHFSTAAMKAEAEQRRAKGRKDL